MFAFYFRAGVTLQQAPVAAGYSAWGSRRILACEPGASSREMMKFGLCSVGGLNTDAAIDLGLEKQFMQSKRLADNLNTGAWARNRPIRTSQRTRGLFGGYCLYDDSLRDLIINCNTTRPASIGPCKLPALPFLRLPPTPTRLQSLENGGATTDEDLYWSVSSQILFE
jgi:hypothetical protein